MSEQKRKMTDEDYRAIADIKGSLCQTLEEAITTHGISNAMEAMSRFAADVLIKTAEYHPSQCPFQAADEFGDIIHQIVVDKLAQEVKH